MCRKVVSYQGQLSGSANDLEQFVIFQAEIQKLFKRTFMKRYFISFEEDVQTEAEAVASAALSLAPGFVGRAVPPPRAHRSTSSWPPSAVY